MAVEPKIKEATEKLHEQQERIKHNAEKVAKTAESIHENASKHRESRNDSRNIIWSVYWRDVKRVLLNPVALVIIVAIFFLPGLYAWCGISANWDPYGNTGNMEVAVVNNDVAVDSETAGHLDIGTQLVDNLKENKSIKWEFMSYDEAMDAIAHDDVYAVIVIPDHFSQDFANIFKGESVRDFCHFQYYIDEKKNAVGVKVGDTAASTIESQINEKFTKQVSEVLAQKVTDITKKGIDGVKSTTLTIADRLNMISSTINSLDSTMGLSQTSVADVQSAVDSAIAGLNEVKSQRAPLESSLAHVSSSVSIFQSELDSIIKDLEDAGLTDLASALKEIVDSMVSIQTALNNLKGVVADLDGTCDKALIALNDTNTMLNKLQNINGNLRVSLNSSAANLSGLASRLSSFDNTKMGTIISKIYSMDSKSLATFMSSAVQLDTVKMFPIETYGTGVAPFYSCLTFWIGGFCILALIHIEVQKPRRRRMTAKEAFTARWLLFITIAIFQGAACAAGDLLIGIQCENVPLFFLTCIFSSIVFVTIIYTLSACLKHIGKALTVVLVVIQIPGSSGMYPIDIMPDAFKALHPFLPFTYAINALRETIVAFNMQQWLNNMGMLLFMLVLFLIIGLFARNSLVSINNLFDHELRKNGIIECEHTETASVHGKLAVENIVGAMSSSQEYANQMSSRAERFMKSYKYQRGIAIFGMGALPVIFLGIMSYVFTQVEVEINTKVILIIVWLLIIIVFALYIVALEYIRTKIHLLYDNNSEDLEALEGDDAVIAQAETAGANA